jgi:quinol monooxygenase YgiN
MYVSRLSFHTRPGHTEEVARRLKNLADMVVATGPSPARVLRISMASPGAPDLQFEQEFASLADLEHSMQRVVAESEFQQWSRETSELLLQPPKREILTIEE